jgi:hypothetical protein
MYIWQMAHDYSVSEWLISFRCLPPPFAVLLCG